jgi:uncharacterized damage-inducible protein DinB
MLAPNMILTMFQYGHDTNNRLLDKAAQVTPEQWDARQEADQRSLHETLFHILAVEEEYLALCQHGQPIWNSRSFADYPDAASLRTFSNQVYTTYLPYLESLSDAQLTAKATAVMPHGVVQSVMIWHLLVHMLYHSAQHRSESASILTRQGQSPSFIDFFGYGDWGAD